MIRAIFSSRILRFAAVGGTVTLFFMGLNALLSRGFGISPRIAFLVAYPPALFLHYALNKLWTFRDGRTTSGRHLAEYLNSVVVTFLIQWPCFLLLQGAFRMPGWLAAGGANVLQMAVSYTLLRRRVFGAPAAGSPDNASEAWHRLLVLVTAIGACALLAWTSLGGWKLPHFGGPQSDYYNLLVSGFRKGSLAMDVAVPDALKAAENPWDPAKRPPIAVIHDASYYKGHYYLYFGVVPVVLLFWPFRAVMGYELPLVVATPLFLILAALLSTGLWVRILRDRFPRAGLTTKIGGSLVLGLCSGQLILARRPSIWEMPISAGHFFLVGMVCAAYLALRSRRPWGWLALSGLALGLAVGCRPSLAVAGAGLACLVVAVGCGAADPMDVRSRLRRSALAALSAGIPLLVILAGLLAYNRARFGNPFEFGLNYQLNSGYEAMTRHFQLHFAPFNLAEYFTRAPQWGRYFPFVHPSEAGVKPEGYYGVEFVYGALVVCPVLWFALLALGYARRSAGGAERAFAGIVLAVALATTGVLACFNTAAARYETDFLPWWSWLAVLGWASFERRLAPSKGPAGLSSRIMTSAFGGCAVATLLLAFVQSCAVHGVLKSVDPEAYFEIARAGDTPAALAERIGGQRLGRVQMDVRFAKHNQAAIEPLIVSGVGYEADYFFVFYKTSTTVQLGYENSGDSPLLSEDLHVDPSRVYRLTFAGGSLFPPEPHPAYAGWTRADVRHLLNDVEIDFDGRPVIHQERQTQDGAPEFLQWGHDARGGALGRRFSGTLLSVRREPLVPPPRAAEGDGDLVLNVTLPAAVVPGSQPLVEAGWPGHAEILGLRTLDEGHFALTYEFWGAGMWESPPIAVPHDRNATFRIRMPSLLSSSNRPADRVTQGLVVVWMNGLPVWRRRSAGEIDPNPPVDLLINSVGSSAMRGSFQGRLNSWRREPVGLWRAGPFAAIELDFEGKGTGTETLVATGTTGRADTLGISWLPGARARLVYDHWGTALNSSADFGLDESGIHHLKIVMPSFQALDKVGAAAGTGIVRVEVDSATVWETRVSYYPAASGTFSFGRNRAGSSVAADRLSIATLGEIRQVR